MKKTLILLSICATLAIGCDWEGIEKNAAKVGDVAGKVEAVGAATSPYTGGYGGLIGNIAGAIGIAALSLSNFAKSKKAKKIAKAASDAADASEGGGQKLVKAAHANGVSAEIVKAYKEKQA